MLRRVLVDHTRVKNAVKRGGNRQQVTLHDAHQIATDDAIDLLALDEALKNLEADHEELARIVEMRFFAGLDDESIADVLGLSTDTIRKRWRLARALLLREMNGPEV